MNRTTGGIGVVALVILAAIATAYLNGVVRGAALAVLAVAGFVAVGRLFAPYREIERTVLGLRASEPTVLDDLVVPQHARSLVDGLNNFVRSTRTDIEALERGLSDLSTLLDRMEEGVIAVHEEGRVQVANRAAREILGFTPETERSSDLSRVRSAELRAVLETSLQTAIRPRSLHVGHREVVVESHPIEDGSIVSLRDVTDVRRLEQVRTDFVANASHELKTPLTAVRGFAETLLDDPDAPPEIRRQFLGLIFENTLRLQNIVEDLLDLSRLESGGWSPEVEAVDVAKIVQGVWVGVQEGRGAKQTFAVRGEGRVWADRLGLHHILRNLLDNAVRHTEADGKIEVVVEPMDGTVKVSVADDGVGIPPDALPRIFERFFRVDKARSRAQGGTGLGLAIVSHLISRMGGDVSAESQYGVGTTIVLQLPEAKRGSEPPKQG